MRVISIAQRPDPGASSGGPPGVLFTQRALLGENHNGVDLGYRFETEPSPLRRKLEDAIKLGGLLQLERRMRSSADIGRAHPDAKFIVHDIQSAAGLASVGADYVLIYHSQGGTVHERAALTGRPPASALKAVLNRVEATAFKHAQKVYFPSHGAHAAFLETSPLAAEDFEFGGVLYNTLLAREKTIAPSASLIDDLKGKPGPLFMSVGHFSSAKGLDRVPSLLARLRDAGLESFTWAAIGSGPLLPGVREEAARLGIAQNCHFISERVDHPVILALMDIADWYVMLHRLSIFDFASLEAMRAGCAMILSRSGGNPEFNVEENILFYDEDHADEDVAHITRADTETMGALNRRAYHAHFDEANFSARYRDVIDDLCAPAS